MKFQEAFRKLNGRDAQQADILEFERLVTVLETTPNDSLLAVLVALGYYRSLYAEVPGKIQEASVAAVNNFKDVAEALAKAAMATTQETLTKAVVEASVEVANKTATAKSRTEMFKWGAVSAGVAAVLLAATFWYGHSTGEKTGYAAAIQVATDQKAAASWAATPQGELAFKMAKSGALDGVANCSSSKAWVKKNGFCYPHPDKEGFTTGWRIE